jgi:hypothetical protein
VIWEWRVPILKEYSELVEKLKELKARGYVRTHRAGDTGLGKTLEDLLGIHENNVPGPNGVMVELKSARKDSTSMMTLFTKSPLPRSANSVLLEGYGYATPESGGKKILHTTVNASEYNTLRGRTGFKIEIREDRVELAGDQGKVLGYWDKTTLKERFEAKLPRLLYVKADARGSGDEEEFWYNEAWLLSGFGFDGFLSLLRERKILCDIRIGQYPNGRPHDHGTAFRVLPASLDVCFSHRERVVWFSG